jgi:glutathione S-transferase
VAAAITLHAFGPMFGLPDASPFVTKAEVLLKLSGLPYRTDTTGFRRAPKGKLPYIEDGGVVVADSTFIRWHLEAKYGVDFDRGLSARDRALAWSVEKMLEEHLYFAALDERWLDDANFARGPAQFFAPVPAPARPLVKAMVRRQVRARLRAQGMGRHSHAERAALGTASIRALVEILGEKDWLFGPGPCGADATAFAFAAGVLCPLFEGSLRRAAEGFPNLVAYERRLRARFYPDLAGDGDHRRE